MKITAGKGMAGILHEKDDKKLLEVGRLCISTMLGKQATGRRHRITRA